MSEHKQDRPDRPRFVIPEKPKHPLGWACEDCFHVVKDTAIGSKSMKCCAHPPIAQLVMMGGGQAAVSINPPVQEGEWCGEFIPARRF